MWNAKAGELCGKGGTQDPKETIVSLWVFIKVDTGFLFRAETMPQRFKGHSPRGTKGKKSWVSYKADKRGMGLAFPHGGPVWSLEKSCISPSQHARSYEIEVREGVVSQRTDHKDDLAINVGD